MQTKADRREQARQKAKYGMKTQQKWWIAVANSQMKRGAIKPKEGRSEKPDRSSCFWLRKSKDGYVILYL
jgi:hypothetical protein